MTNAEKFKEVFGFDLSRETCIAPDNYICEDVEYCDTCRWANWHDEEYSSTKTKVNALYKGAYIGNCPKCGAECISGLKEKIQCWNCKYIFELENKVV